MKRLAIALGAVGLVIALGPEIRAGCNKLREWINDWGEQTSLQSTAGYH